MSGPGGERGPGRCETDVMPLIGGRGSRSRAPRTMARLRALMLSGLSEGLKCDGRRDRAVRQVDLSGKQHFVGPDMLHGFHERLVPELYPTDFHWTPSWDEVRMDSNNDSSGVTRCGICVRRL